MGRIGIAAGAEGCEPLSEAAELTNREVRKALGLPLIRTAALAGTSEVVARIYEIDRMAVTESKRRALDGVYIDYRARLATKAHG